MASDSTDVVGPLSEFAAGLTFDVLPSEVVTTVKRIFLDTLGTTLAANTLGVGCKELVQVAQRCGGSEDATLLGIGTKVPAPMAALTNGGLAHALNFDDVAGPRGSGHMGVTSIPAALAAAEYRGGVNGRDFLTAITTATSSWPDWDCRSHSRKRATASLSHSQHKMPGCFSAALSIAHASCGFSAAQYARACAHAPGGRQPVWRGVPPRPFMPPTPIRSAC